jgi:hypothetical protein
MNRTISARCRLFGAALVAVGLSEGGTRASNIQTNFVERWVTNTVEVQMQANRFVTEYHTNWLERFSTNVVDVYATNFLTRSITNRLLVDLVQTNLVRAYKTNFQALNLTNWTTVLVFKTNWVNQPVTNVVEIEMASKASAGEPPQSKSTPSRTSSPPETSAAVTLDPSSDTLVIEAAHTARPANNNLFEAQLTVNWSAGREVPVQVQQWRVEKDDRSILVFGQEREFKRALPVGTYNVVVRAQRDAASSMTLARGTLTITPREVLLAQKPPVRKSST